MAAVKLIQVAGPRHIRQITETHKKEFSNLLSGQMGTSFLMFTYKKILKCGIIIVAFSEGNFAGFISGIIDENKMYDLEYYFMTILAVVSHIYSPKVIINLLRYLRKKILLTNEMPMPELFSITVLEKYRRKGIGRLLVGAFEKYLKEKRIKEYKVFTDMEFSKGSKLYDALGFTLKHQLNLNGLTLRMYSKKI